MQKVLIAGATGVLGRAIVKSAVGAGLAVRQGVRNPSKADPVAEVNHLDYGQHSRTACDLSCGAHDLRSMNEEDLA
jgi:nucleoside-diphosphate-sugar epimerase